MTRLSASAVPRLLKCATSAVLPQHRYQTVHAEDGQERHGTMESAADVGAHDELPAAVQELIRPGDELATECAFAFDVATGCARELGHIKRRDYPAMSPYELPGTCDLLIRGNGRICVVDYKGFDQVDTAEDNTQLATYGLMAARTYGYDEVTVAIVYLGGLRRPSIAVLAALDLDAHAERLKQLHGDVLRAAANPEAYLATGKHCTYCPAFMACPRQMELQVDLGSGVVAMRVEGSIPFNDDDEAAAAMELLAQIKLISTRLQAALYARATERPFMLRSGKMLGPREKESNETLVPDVVYEVVKQLHGQHIADAAVVRSATKKQLKEALGYVGAKSVAAAEREVLAAVRAKGGIPPRKKRIVIEEYDAALPAPPLQLVAVGGE